MAFESVDAYIAAQPEPVREILTAVRNCVRAALPEAVECITYDMPTYKCDGKNVVHFAAAKKHYALHAMNEGIRAAFKDELTSYSMDRGTIRFSYDEPVPKDLIARLVRARADAR